MSASDELKIRKLLEDTIFYINNAEEDETFIEKSNNNLNEADNLIRSNTRENLSELSFEVVVRFAEVALMTKNRDNDIQRILDLFFQRTKCEDQFYVRALLAYARVLSRKVQTEGLKGEENLKQIQVAFSHIQKGLDIITKPENKQKYHFLIYNTSITAWKVIKPFLKPGWSKNFSDVIEKLSNLLEELDDSDLNLRCRFLNVLTQSMMDADKKPDALKIYDKLWDLTKKKGECAFQETLLRNRIHLYRDNNGMLGNIKKDTEIGEDKNAFKQLFVLQQIRSGVIPEAQVEKELTTLMASMTPASVAIAEGKDPSTIQSSSKLPPLIQDRLAEAGRMALKYNLIQLAEGSVSVIGRSSQGSLRAKVWTEYSKAELVLKKQKQAIDPKTGMKLNIVQRQVEEFQRRVEALKILDRAMIANKRLNDPDIIIEGSTMIWNFGLPLLKKSTRQYIYKPFQSAQSLLETIESNECQLRVCFHLELAKYEVEQDLLSKAQLQIKKALNLDYSTSVAKLGIELTEDDDPADFQRTFDRYIKSIDQKLALKQNLYGEPETVLEQTIIDVENAKGTKSQKMRETLLEKALKSIIEYEQPDFYVDPERDLVQEEIEQEEKKFHLKCVKERKLKTVLGSEIAKLALEENLIDIALEAGQNCVQAQWDPLKDKEQLICQSEAHYVVAQCFIEYLLEEEIEIGFDELVTLDEDQDERDFTTDDRTQFQEWKKKFAEQIQEGVKKAMSVNQSWLIFNGAIHIWNNYLPVFKKVNFYELVLKDSIPTFQECYESMNNCFISGQFNNENVDYNLSTKMNTFTNLAMILARVHEFNKANDEALRICDTLLQKQLPPQLRKTFDSIRARITKQVGGAAAAGKGAPPAKGKDAAPAAPQPSQSEILTSEVISLIELITAQKGQADKKASEDMIKKAIDSLGVWEPTKEEEIELELHAELWSRLGRLAIDLDNNQMTKTSLFCAETVVKLIPKEDRAKDIIPVMRLRWYAVAQSIYGEALAKLVDTEKQEKESQDKLLFASVEHYVESCNLSTKSNLGFVLIEVVKMMWNTLLPLLDNVTSRRKLIPHMVNVHKHLKQLKEGGDPDFLVLFYSALFTCITENKEWKLGESTVDEAFTYMPQTHQKVLWEAKMLYLSKLGKNVLQAISNMKEGNSSLQAKVWVKLARSSANQFEQHSAYNKAIELLRKDESVEVVEILIEYSEWLHRNKFPTQDVEDNLQLACDQLTDIEPGWDDEEDEEGEDAGDHKSRKTGRSKGSRISRQSMAKTKVSKVSKAKTGARKSMAGGKSTKSRASSRRTAMSRGTNKTKQTKTGLSKRQEEDPQPMFLNISHYEKMLRIHSMFATLAIDSNKQREYALDAHFFIMKIWEQSFQTLNALVFLESHKAEMEQLGFSDKDAESRNFFYSEVFTNPEIKIPVKHDLPEGNQNWINYSIPEEFNERASIFEDKTMLCKWAFVKPELTLHHIQNIITILEENYLHIQMIPIIQLGKFFAKIVLENELLTKVFDLKLARLLINLGLSAEGNKLREDLGDISLDDVTRKVQFENIKALKDPHDDLQNQYTSFEKLDDLEPWVIEQLKIHETWIGMGEELIKWGEFETAMTYIVESNLHARILKDQDNFALTFLHLAFLSHLQGEQNHALQLDMMCQQYSRKVPLIRLSIKQALEHLISQDKTEDAKRLLAKSIEMFENLKSQHDAKVYNVELSMIIQYLFIEQAKLLVGLSKPHGPKSKVDDGQDDNLQESFKAFHKFERMMAQYGWKSFHLEGAIEYSWLLYEMVQTKLSSNLNHIRQLERKLEKTGLILIKVQEILTNQVYHIGIQSDQSFFSLPLIRMIGIVKVKLAQVNNTIGILKNQLKLHIGLLDAADKDVKLDRKIADWLEGITKQIDAQTKQGKRKLNRYEKSIAMLHSALNMLHPQQKEYIEALVELAKCKRLLALNKKHIRGIWRQDANEIDELGKANEIEKLKELELNEDVDDDVGVEGARNIKDEARDKLLNYKDEAIQAFVEILNGTHNTEDLDVFQKILSHVGETFSDNLLARFSLEYAETRGNLNKEQCFAFIAMYQFSVQRQYLWNEFRKQCAKQNVDLLRKQQMKAITREFSYFSSPFMPTKHQTLVDEDKERDKAFENLNQAFPYTDVKEILPQQSCYVIFQLSQDWQYLYVGLSKVPVTAEGGTPGERKFDYHLTKLTLSEKMQNKLQQLVDDFEQIKHAMIKTPITIDKDLNKLISDSNTDLKQIIDELETFFAPITKDLNNLINPEPKAEEEEAAPLDPKAAAAAAKGKPPAKAPPAAKGKGGADELAKYESNLPLTTGGIESLVLLLDHRIATLPFEALKVFEKVPAVSKDFSLHLHANRLKRLGHKAELHNNFGVSKENLKYIFNPNEKMRDGLKDLVAELPKKVAGSKWEGVITTDHIPSSGEWQRLISDSSLFAYYSTSSILHTFSPHQITEIANFNKCRAMVLFERMNTYKTETDKTSLTSKNFRNLDQPLQTIALFSAIGINSMLINHWAVQPETNQKIFETILNESGTNGAYLGAALRNFRALPEPKAADEDPNASKVEEEATKEEPLDLMTRLTTSVWGVPLVRIV